MKTDIHGLIAISILLLSGWVVAAEPEPGEEIISAALALGVEPVGYAPPRGEESEGPFQKLLIENAFIIDGAGAPTQGPVTIEIEGDRIVGLHGVRLC